MASEWTKTLWGQKELLFRISGNEELKLMMNLYQERHGTTVEGQLDHNDQFYRN